MRTYDLTSKNGKPAVGAYLWLVNDLMNAPTVHTGEWQAMNTTASKMHSTHELEDITIFFDPLPRDMDYIVPAIDHAWADDHFLERVSGEPMNPAPSHVDWPYAVRNNADHTGQHHRFDHTYPERFWPKYAGLGNLPIPPVFEGNRHRGIRFDYGDLNDVVDLIVRSPLTRQAYLPVWFPEDTGSVRHQRVPCTLGYHFMVRDGKLSCRYYLRSCDIYRHFSNDVYFAGMLTRWVMQEVNRRSAELGSATPLAPLDLQLGRLVMHISSLHAFVGDRSKITERVNQL